MVVHESVSRAWVCNPFAFDMCDSCMKEKCMRKRNVYVNGHE